MVILYPLIRKSPVSKSQKSMVRVQILQLIWRIMVSLMLGNVPLLVKTHKHNVQ